jgi:hypothetical protein
MSRSRFASRGARPSLACYQALDFGLRVRIDLDPRQRTIFSGAENLSASQLTSELAQMVSGFRVRSFRLRAELEEVTVALQVNVECGFSALARRAALDLASLLASARKRRLADSELCFHGTNCALRIAELCEEGVQ